MAELSPEKVYSILVRGSSIRRSQISLEAKISETLTERGLSAELPISTSLSPRQSEPTHSTGWQSLPVTPRDSTAENGGRLIDGVGCHFPATPPSRAQFLAMDGENATDGAATPRTVSDTWGVIEDSRPLALEENVMVTPRVNEYHLEPWIPPSLLGRSVFGPVPPLTPGLTPSRKRSSSPPSAPRTAKRPKLRARRVDTGLEAEMSSQAAASYPNDTRVGSSSEYEDFQGSDSDRTYHCPEPRYTLEIECFSEDEIEEHLAEYLNAYRAFYLEPDEAEPPRPRDPHSARRSRRIFKTIFEDQLTSAEDEELLLQGEKEDILDVLLTWTRKKSVPSGFVAETLEDVSESLKHPRSLPAAPFIKQICLSAKTRDGSLFAAHLSACGLGGIIEWNLDDIRDAFCGITGLGIA